MPSLPSDQQLAAQSIGRSCMRCIPYVVLILCCVCPAVLPLVNGFVPGRVRTIARPLYGGHLAGVCLAEQCNTLAGRERHIVLCGPCILCSFACGSHSRYRTPLLWCLERGAVVGRWGVVVRQCCLSFEFLSSSK